jgi:hypothetical protein
VRITTGFEKLDFKLHGRAEKLVPFAFLWGLTFVNSSGPHLAISIKKTYY